MGWQERGWFLGDHGPALFDRTGNIGPTVWCDGRIVGGWAHRADGTVAVRLLDDVGAEARAAVEAQAERLAARIGPVRVVPRFRTPLERELSA
jgi:Winged helix DNA-binding domain